MSAKKNQVSLRAEERADLEVVVRSFKLRSLERRRARILLGADQAQPGGAATDAQIAARVGACELTVSEVRRRWCERVEALRAGGLPARQACRHGEQKRRAAPKLDGAAQARLSALACTAAPAGHKRWTPKLLALELVEAGVVESISGEAVRLALKKTSSSHG